MGIHNTLNRDRVEIEDEVGAVEEVIGKELADK